jgi:hypothetical protein
MFSGERCKHLASAHWSRREHVAAQSVPLADVRNRRRPAKSACGRIIDVRWCDSCSSHLRFRRRRRRALPDTVNRFHRTTTLPVAAGIAVTTAVVAAMSVLVAHPPALVAAGPLGTEIPANCVEHVSFSGGSDAVGDFRCAGLAISFHTGGVARSPFPIWAGQWLFTDLDGQYRVGSCTFNKGVHPTIDEPSKVVTQRFPNDPTGQLGAYLTWRYGSTTDNLTAAAMWIVFHYFAQDAAGTNRASNGWAPLVPSLDGVAADSGRDDLQQRALDLHAESLQWAAVGSSWRISVDLDRTHEFVEIAVVAGESVVASHPVTVDVAGGGVQRSSSAVTDERGTVRLPVRTLLAGAAPGATVAVSAQMQSPGPALVFRGAPAAPDPDGAQTLVTDGPGVVLVGTVDVQVPVRDVPSTTAATPTTTAPTTTLSPTTTEAPSTTSTSTTSTSTTTTTTPSSTTASTTTEASASTVAQAGPTTMPSTTAAMTSPSSPTSAAAVPTPPPAAPLPRTGIAMGPAHWATLALVAGIGLIGTVRRRTLGA